MVKMRRHHNFNHDNSKGVQYSMIQTFPFNIFIDILSFFRSFVRCNFAYYELFLAMTPSFKVINQWTHKK